MPGGGDENEACKRLLAKVAKISDRDVRDLDDADEVRVWDAVHKAASVRVQVQVHQVHISIQLIRGRTLPRIQQDAIVDTIVSDYHTQPDAVLHRSP